MRIVRRGAADRPAAIAGRAMRATCGNCRSRIAADGSELTHPDWSFEFGYRGWSRCPVCDSAVTFYTPWWRAPGSYVLIALWILVPAGVLWALLK